jgi:hypothetical protein
MISRRTRGSAAGKNSYRVAIKQFIQVGIGGIYVAPQQLDAAVNSVTPSRAFGVNKQM